MKRKLLLAGLITTLSFTFVTAVGVIVSHTSNAIYGVVLGILMLVATVLLMLLRKQQKGVKQ